jgi:hypothetical protein
MSVTWLQLNQGELPSRAPDAAHRCSGGGLPLAGAGHKLDAAQAAVAILMRKASSIAATQEPVMSIIVAVTGHVEGEHNLVRNSPVCFLERATRPVSLRPSSLHESEEGSSPFRHNMIVRRTHGILGRGLVAQDALPACPFWAKSLSG